MFDFTKMGGDVNQALAATGSEYRVPDAPEWAQAAGGLVGKGGVTNPQGPKGPNTPNGPTGLQGAPIVDLVKKVVGAVASFYTGGMASAAINVGGNLAAENNPKAGRAASVAGGFV
jgi:hypothetical protein